MKVWSILENFGIWLVVWFTMVAHTALAMLGLNVSVRIGTQPWVGVLLVELAMVTVMAVFFLVEYVVSRSFYTSGHVQDSSK